MTIILIDAFDSFSHIIYQYLRVLGHSVQVHRSGELRPEDVHALRPKAVVLGPGPGHPQDSGHVQLVQHLAGLVPIIGICLGHQAIALAFGGEVVRAPAPRHGKVSCITHNGAGPFRGVPAPCQVTRYHSLAVDERALPPELEVTARADDDGVVMALTHRTLPIVGVQFHPESVLTQAGLTMLDNTVRR